MRIAIDARMMGAGNTRGIGRYIQELIGGLVSLDSGHVFVLLERHPEGSPFLGISGVEHMRADIPWYGMEEQRLLPSLIRGARADLVHFPHWNVPFWYRGKFVMTVHDLLLRNEPISAKISTRNFFTRFVKRLGYRLTLRRAVDGAQAIFAPTNFVKDEIASFYPLASSKTVVTGEGLSRLPEADARRVPDHPFLFYVGSAYPHKRLELLLDIWKTMGEKYRTHELVIAGEQDIFMKRLMDRVVSEKIPRVTFPGRITDAELAGFLDHADLFVFPSSHEGFGLPTIEALSHGCPVLAADIPALVEILPKDGVFFFRNGDRDAMIRTLDTTLQNLARAKEDAMRGKSFVVSRFDWKTVAEKTLKTYECVIHA